MTRRRTGWAVAAAGLVVSAAAGLLVWLAQAPPAEDAARAAGAADAGPTETHSDARPRRRAAAAATGAPGASVEIDDAPLPEGAEGSIRGTVRDDVGRPVAGARVGAAPTPLSGRDVWYGDFDAQTGDDGAYAISGLDPSVVWHVVAEADGHVRARPAEAVVMTADRPDATCDLVVARCGSIEATVLDAAGAPVPHSIRVIALDGDDSRAPDPAEVPPGRWRVFADAPGRAGDSRVVDVAAGEATRVEFRLGEEVEITGTLLGSDGTPVGRLEVVAVAADDTLDPLDVAARAAADGTFRLRGLRRTRYRLALCDLDVVADGPPPVLAPATGVTLRIREDSKVTFRLVYPAGFPAADRSADVAVVVSDRWHSTRPSPHWEYDQGTVRVPPGEDLDLAITALHCATWHRSVLARPGELLDIGEVGLVLARDVEDTVANAAGKPVRGAEVRCGAGALRRFWFTDAVGAFRIERIPRTDCELEVQGPGFVAARVACRADDAAPLTVKIVRGGLLWVGAASAVGTPLSGAAVRIDDAAGTAWWAAPTALDDRGECAVRLAPGRWRIAVAGCAPAEADVREGAVTSVRVRRP